MKLNTKFYKGKEELGSDTENKIYEYVTKYEHLEEAFNEDSSWPVVYNLSNVRENIIAWYPFNKKDHVLEIGAGMGAITSKLCEMCGSVTSIEQSKVKANIILERNKNMRNLEIIVGEFNNIKFEHVFDYIILNGTFETNYQSLDFMNKLKSLLVKDGKILITLNNKLGLKYWCGVKDEHSDSTFFNESDNTKLLTKNEIIEIADNLGMKTNFHYVYPDYKFPELILDDKGLKKNINYLYNPYFKDNDNIVIDEKKLFNILKDNNLAGEMANSFFVEMSTKNSFNKISYVKFNNERKRKYALMTCYDGVRFYKKGLYDETSDHLNKLITIYNNACNLGINITNHYFHNKGVYTSEQKGDLLFDIMKKLYFDNNEKELNKHFDNIHKYIKKYFKITNEEIENNIFDFYSLGVDEEKLALMHFTKYALVDIIPECIYLDNVGNYVLTDQEWDMENVPIEYIIYHSIKSFFKDLDVNSEKIKTYLIKYIDESLIEPFEMLEEEFINEIITTNNNYYKFYNSYNLVNPDQLIEKLNDDVSKLNGINEDLIDKIEVCNSDILKKEEMLHEEINKNNELTESNNSLNKELDDIRNLKGYNFMVKLNKFLSKFKKKVKKGKVKEVVTESPVEQVVENEVTETNEIESISEDITLKNVNENINPENIGENSEKKV